MPLSINKPKAIIIPVIEVWWRGRSISLQPKKTKDTENGRIAVTIIPGLIPKKKKLKLNTKKDAIEKLFINSLNFVDTYFDSS